MQATTETMFINEKIIKIYLFCSFSLVTMKHKTNAFSEENCDKNQTGDKKNSAFELKFSENWFIIYGLLNINQYLQKGKNYFQLCTNFQQIEHVIFSDTFTTVP